MILEETLNKFIRDIINLILANPNFSIKSKQKNMVRPQNSFADVDFLSENNRGHEQRIYTNNDLDPDLTETLKGLRDIIFSVSFYRDNAADNARRVKAGFKRESVLQLAKEANIGFTTISDIRNIDEVLDGNWELRSQFDITLSVVGTDSDIITAIETVDIAGEYQARGLVYNFNIEVE